MSSSLHKNTGYMLTWKWSRWRNGLARLQQWPCYLQGPGFESPLWPVTFFAGSSFSPLANQAPALASVPCVPTPKQTKRCSCRTQATQLLCCMYLLFVTSNLNLQSTLVDNYVTDSRFLRQLNITAKSLSVYSVVGTSAKAKGVKIANYYQR